MNEARAILADVVARLFTERVTRELRQSAETDVWPAALWTAVEENGLTLPLVPEAKGGAGSTWGDAHVVVSAAGRHAVPLPLPETIVAAWLLAGAGLDVPAGPLTLAPAQRDDDLRVKPTTGGFRLDGTARRVPWGAVARYVVVVAAVDGHTLVARAAAGSFRVEPDRNLAREPRDTLVFDATPVAAAPAGVGVPPDAVWQYGALVRAAQIAGGVDAILRSATRYATERRQFGKPIGAYQAIQQNLAVLAGHAAAADIAAAHAFRAADRGDAAFEIGVAKVRAGEAGRGGGRPCLGPPAGSSGLGAPGTMTLRRPAGVKVVGSAENRGGRFAGEALGGPGAGGEKREGPGGGDAGRGWGPPFL